MRAVLIVNPFASRVTRRIVHEVERTLAPAETIFTERPGHATDLTRELAMNAETIYVFSGDGGFNEALNGCDGGAALGFIPGGGTNVLPRALGLPRDPVAAARRLARGRARRISLGRVNGRRFGFSAGVGLDAELIRRVDAIGRSHEGTRPGDRAFAAAALRLLVERRGRLAPALEVRGLGRAAFALVANCDPYTYLGRLPLHAAPEARFEVGLDVVGAREVRPGALPRFLAYAVLGRGHRRAGDVLYAHDLDRIVVTCDAPLPLQTDGEDLGDVTDAVFAAERGAVSVLV